MFLKSLVHDWDRVEWKDLKRKDRTYDKQFSIIMKHVRNWSAHNSIFFELNEESISFIFLICMRATFNLKKEELLNFEKTILCTFDNTSIDDSFKLEKIIEDGYKKLRRNYISLREKNKSDIYKKLPDNKVTYIDMCNQIAQYESKKPQSTSIINISDLYMLYWNSLHYAEQTMTEEGFEIQFKNVDPHTIYFLDKFSEHFYNITFSKH